MTSVPSPEDSSSFAESRPDVGALQARIQELLEERHRIGRRRRVHLALLGLAVSLPIHIMILIWLSVSYKEPPPGAGERATVVLDLSVLTDESLQDMLEPFETEDMLTPEVQMDPGDESMALEVDQSLELPKLELDRAAAGLSTELGGDGVGSGTGLGSGQGAGTAFFGIRAKGNRFAYVVDISGSMRNQGRLQLAMNELKRSLQALPDYAQFKIALYSDDAVLPPFQSTWLRAGANRVRQCSEWLDQQAPTGGTDPVPAFQYLFSERPRPDVVFFLTDGEIPRGADFEILTLNLSPGGRPAMINCVAFSADASQAALREIAQGSGGTFKFVPDTGGQP